MRRGLENKEFGSEGWMMDDVLVEVEEVLCCGRGAVIKQPKGQHTHIPLTWAVCISLSGLETRPLGSPEGGSSTWDGMDF